MTQGTHSKTCDEVRADLRRCTADEQRRRTAAAIAQREPWAADESGYDEQTWPMVKRAMPDHRRSERDPFGEAHACA
jgi:hypothetical protein